MKRSWFNECVFALDLGLFADKEKSIKVVDTELGGGAALAITAFQICCTESYIAKQGYVAKSATKDFVNLIYDRVSGAQLSDLQRYVERYGGAGDYSTQQFRLGVDVTHHIIGREPSNFVAMHTASLSNKLAVLSYLAIARAFGDTVESDKLTKRFTALNN